MHSEYRNCGEKKSHNSTIGLNTVYVNLAAARTEIRATLIPPTLQPVNANQNDKHVTVHGQLSTTCHPSTHKPLLAHYKKPLQESSRVVIFFHTVSLNLYFYLLSSIPSDLN